MDNLDKLILFSNLYPCPPFRGGEVSVCFEIHPYLRDNSKVSKIMLFYKHTDDVGYCRRHVRSWINHLCLFINIPSYIINLEYGE